MFAREKNEQRGGNGKKIKRGKTASSFAAPISELNR